MKVGEDDSKASELFHLAFCWLSNPFPSHHPPFAFTISYLQAGNGHLHHLDQLSLVNGRVSPSRCAAREGASIAANCLSGLPSLSRPSS